MDTEKFKTLSKSRITTRLLQEYNHIRTIYGLSLKTPILTISDTKTTLGQWNATTRAMMVSSRVIADQPWYVVVEILKHEIAHQMVSEIYGDKESGHGSQFQRACRCIQVKPIFCTSYCDIGRLDEAMKNENKTDDRNTAKISKLLRLAESENINEASSALEKAYQLIAKNETSGADVQEEGVKHEVIELGVRRISRERLKICALLIEFFKVEVVQSSSYNAHADREEKTFEVIGRPQDVKIALYCYRFLDRQMLYHWNEEKKKILGDKRGRKTGFCLGVLAGFEQKLQARHTLLQNKDVTGHGEGENDQLVAVGDKEIIEYLGKRYPRLVKIRKKSLKVDSNLYARGSAIGKDINFYDAIEPTSNSVVKQLT